MGGIIQPVSSSSSRLKVCFSTQTSVDVEGLKLSLISGIFDEMLRDDNVVRPLWAQQQYQLRKGGNIGNDVMANN